MYQRNFVHDVRETFLYLKKVESYVTDKTGCRMIEIVDANFVADEFAIFGTVNEDYVRRELEWYESMSLNVNTIKGGVPDAWLKTANAQGEINSNYGWIVWHWENGHQFENCRAELTKNPESRRAVMIYTRPRMWKDYNRGGMSDFMCTNVAQYFIRDGKLNVVVQMRSNDVVFGYKNDRAWQAHVQKKLAAELGVPAGAIYWSAGSLHVYERHFHLVA